MDLILYRHKKTGKVRHDLPEDTHNYIEMQLFNVQIQSITYPDNGFVQWMRQEETPQEMSITFTMDYLTEFE